MQEIKNLLSTFQETLKRGFIYVFAGNLISKISRFIASMVIVRIINKTSYGAWTYALNIFQIIMLFDGLGIAPGILQFCSRYLEKARRIAFLRFGLKYGIIANSLFGVVMLLIATFIKLPVQGANKLLFLLAGVPILKIIFSVLTQFLRSSFWNKTYGLVMSANAASYMVFSIVLSIILGVYGLVTTEYIVAALGIIIVSVALNKDIKSMKNNEYVLQPSEKSSLVVYSLTATATNSISQLLYLLDTFLVGYFSLDSKIVASYKVATLIPLNLSFIPLSVMVFAYPYFARNMTNKKWIKEKYSHLVLSLMLLNSVITVLLFSFAPHIVKIVFGSNYLDTVPVFRVLSIGYFIAGTFRIPAGNLLPAIGKIKVNLKNAILSGVSNIILDIVLIKLYGPIGAAFATVSIFIISSLYGNFYLIKYLKE